MTRVERFGDQKLEKGVGRGIWATAAALPHRVFVARGLGIRLRASISLPA
jgi:hypothetical protein